jgi:hypothetical protein
VQGELVGAVDLTARARADERAQDELVSQLPTNQPIGALRIRIASR